MDEEFESLVVTNPELVDPGIDISGLKTQTDTSLLGNIPDFAGIQYEAFNPTRLTDLMRLYSTGLPMIDTPAAAVPPATGGGDAGSGDGGQATIPTDDFNQQEFEENLIDQGVGLQIAPGQPVVAPGEVPVTNLDLAIDNDPMLGVVDVDGEGEFGGLDEGADPDRIQANEFAGIESPTGIGPTYDEAGLPDTSIPDRNRGQIPTSTDEFDVTTDQFTRPTMADVAGPVVPIDPTSTMLDVPSTEVLGIGVQPEFDKTFVDSTTGEEMTVTSPYTLGNVYTGEFDPDDEGTVFDTTSITPEDTEESITQKVANYLGVDTSKINKAAVTGALNLVAGKALDTAIPVFTVIDLVKDAFVKSPEEAAAEEQARQDNMDEAAAITQRLEDEVTEQDIIDDRGRGQIPTRTEPEPTPTFEPPRGGGADRDPAPSAPTTPSSPPSVISRPTPTFTPRGGGADRDPAPAPKSKPTPTPRAPDFVTGGGGGNGRSSNDGGGGCCFIMLEARYGDGTMDKVVRRYRDENMTPRNRRGYYKVAEVLVPLMRKSKIFKWIVTKTFADPLVSYGKWYYGENKHGWIFAPIKSAWLKLFDVVGTDTVFIRENGEEV